jgi:8-oxo-dGTP pyrophosphatase MutT (NUDIX family)
MPAEPRQPAPAHRHNQEHQYQVRARHERFHGNVFSVVTDEVVMPDGHVADRDYVVHVGAVGVLALDEHDRVVLVRQYRHALGRDLWELPAGLADVPGEPAVVTARRELAEEADLTAARWDVLARLHPSPGCSNECIQLYLARDLAPVPPGQRHVRTHEEATMGVRRVDLDDAVAMVFAGEISNAACAVGVLAAARARDQGWQRVRPV